MRWRVLTVVALVVLAGCGSVVGPDGESDAGAGSTTDGTVTPAPVPEVTATPDPWSVAPGLSPAGVVDVDALAEAHLAAVEGRSYVWREYRGAGDPTAPGTGTPAANGSVDLTLVQRARVEREDTYAYWAASQRIYLGKRTRHRYNYTEYVVDGTGYTRLPSLEWDLDGPVPLQTGAASQRIGSEAVRAIERYLAVGTANATVSRTSVDGRRYYRVDGARASLPTVDPVRDYSVTALVSPDGFVRSLTVAYTTTDFEGPRRVRYRFAYDRVGETTVDPPAWVTGLNRTGLPSE